MRKRINSAVADVEANFKAGKLPWCYSTVHSLIEPYPHKGHLDLLLVGQEDEATLDPDGVPWEVADAGAGEGGEEEPHGDGDDPDDVPGFDPADWTDGVAMADVYPAPQHRGDGDGAGHAQEALPAHEADVLSGHSNRMQSLKQASEIFTGMHDTVGASMSQTVKRVVHEETKRFNERIRGKPEVEKEMRAMQSVEESQAVRELAEY